MTVKELINELLKEDPNAIVVDSWTDSQRWVDGEKVFGWHTRYSEININFSEKIEPIKAVVINQQRKHCQEPLYFQFYK